MQCARSPRLSLAGVSPGCSRESVRTAVLFWKSSSVQGSWIFIASSGQSLNSGNSPDHSFLCAPYRPHQPSSDLSLLETDARMLVIQSETKRRSCCERDQHKCLRERTCFKAGVSRAAKVLHVKRILLQSSRKRSVFVQVLNSEGKGI